MILQQGLFVNFCEKNLFGGAGVIVGGVELSNEKRSS